jgi:hypothetical protein
MKKSQHTSAIAMFMVIVALFFTATQSHAASSIHNNKPSFQENKRLVYERSVNPYIGITPDESTKGSSYQVIDENGKTVYSGKINAAKTFYLSTNKLGNGYFTFYINGFMVQQFVVN